MKTTNAKRWIEKCLAKVPDMPCGVMYRDATLQLGDAIKLDWDEFQQLYSELKYA